MKLFLVLCVVFTVMGCGVEEEVVVDFEKTPEPQTQNNVEKKKDESLRLAPNQAGLQKSIKEAAQKMEEHFMKGEIEQFSKFTHPAVIKQFGEKEYVQYLKENHEKVKNKTKKKEFGKVSPVLIDYKRFAAFINVESHFDFNGGIMKQKSYYIACSVDEGKTWTFIGGTGRKEQQPFFKTHFPVLTKHIEFPKCSNELLNAPKGK